jgi:hypothetical protein
MSYGSCLYLSLGMLAGAVCAATQEAPAPHLNARELFYNTAAAQTPAPATAQAKPVTQANSNAKRPRRPVAPTAAPASTPPPVETAQNTPSAPPPAPPAVPSAAPGSGGAHVIPVSLAEPAPSSPPAPALGLKYTITKLVENQPVEVAPNTVFHAGDRIRFSVEPNGPGYLYIVRQGSSGTWEPVFPAPEIADSSNRVEGWRTYTMPPKSRLVFDQQTGTEKIFIVLSRNELPDLEQLMYSLKNGVKPASAPEAQPKAPAKTLVADLRIDDATVGRLRNTYARDLIIEKVDEDTPGDRKEKAVYVVNPTGSTDSRVVADIELVHQ